MFNLPGIAPERTDSELIAVSLIGECSGCRMENELLSSLKEYLQHLFPHITS